MVKVVKWTITGLALVMLGAAAPASFSVDELELLEAEKASAQQALAALEAASDTSRSDLDTLESRLIAAAMESQRREEEATAAELKLIDLRTRLAAAETDLLADDAALEDLLGVLASSGRRQPPALVVSPRRANDAIRRAILTGDAAPQLAARVETLSGEVADMNRLEAQITRERARLATAEAVLDLKQAEILEYTAQKRAAYQSLAGEAETLREKVVRLAKEAATLRTLLGALEDNAPPMPTHKPSLRTQFAALSPSVSGTMTDAAPITVAAPRPLQPLGTQSLGNLAAPAAGDMSLAFGDRLPGGGRAQGLFIQTRESAQVAAPIDGRIDYADQFRTYGQMLILRTSDGYHVILSGMGELYARPGDTVSAGEPIGRMPGRTDPPPELYLELRKDGEPMNPASWMK